MTSLISRLQTWLGGLLGATTSSAPNASETVARASIEHEPDQSVVPFDENLLERSRTQWQFGDWASLAAITRETLQHHPDRAKLALLAAAGHQGLGNASAARQQTRLAMDWGCSKKLVSQILISGAHNSLGRAAAVAGQEQRALKHFQAAIQTGAANSDVRLLIQARVGHQLADMGLIATPAFQAATLTDWHALTANREALSDTEVLALVKQCLASDDVHASADSLLADPTLSGANRVTILTGLASFFLTEKKDKFSAITFLRQAMRQPDADQISVQVTLVRLLIEAGSSADAAEHMLQRSLRSLPPLPLDQTTAEQIARAYAADRATVEKKAEHGHDLLLDWLRTNLKHLAPSAKPRVLIEIGTTREDIPGQGSTAKLAAFCKLSGLHFVTVDMDPHNTLVASQLFKELGMGFDAITMKGEDYLRQYAGTFDFIFLDAYDFDHGHHSELRQSRYQKFLGGRIDEQLCHQMHLECAQSCISKLATNGVICMDDTWLDAGKWTAKGTLAMPHLTQNGFSVIEARNRAALLVRAAMQN